MDENRHLVSTSGFYLLLAVFIGLPVKSVLAAETYWQLDPPAVGDWSNASNWTAGEPTADDYAYINNGGTATITAPGEVCALLNLGYSISETETLELSGDGQLSAEWEAIGHGGTGLFTQTGGANTVTNQLRIGFWSLGTYELSGDGELSAGTEYVGGPDLGAKGVFTQTGGTNTVSWGLYLAYFGGEGTYTISGGTLTTRVFVVGAEGRGTLNIMGSAPQITIWDTLFFGHNSTFTAVPGATIHMLAGWKLRNRSLTPSDLGDLRYLNLIFEGAGTIDPVEVAGEDLLATTAGYQDNFALGALIFAGGHAVRIQLVDNTDNQSGPEALYVENLTVGAGSYLDLNGLNLYYINAVIDPTSMIVGGVPIQVPVIPGDANLDGVVNVGDLGIFGANYGESGRTWRTGDFNCDGIVNVGDLGILGVNYGAGGGGAAVPEPGMISLTILGALTLLRKRS